MACYVDVLEARQARGVMGSVELDGGDGGERGRAAPGNSPSPSPKLRFGKQLDLFD